MDLGRLVSWLAAVQAVVNCVSRDLCQACIVSAERNAVLAGIALECDAAICECH